MQFALVQERVMNKYYAVKRQVNTFGTIMFVAKIYMFANKLLMPLYVRLIQAKMKSMKA